MTTSKPKKKIIIQTLSITELERFRQFEIKLPANVKRVTRVLFTATF